MCGMRRIVDGVWELSFAYVHAHLIATDDGLVLVDTGLPNRADRIEAAITEAGHRLADLRTILMTHRHPDHIGSLAELKRRTEVEVVAHAADVAVIEGRAPQPRHSFLMRVTSRLPMMKAEGAPVDRVLTGDGPTGVPGVTAFHTPGHTVGHLSFLLARDGGVLFVGDAATSRGSRVVDSPKPVNEDPAAGSASISRLAELDFQFAVFGHGKAVCGQAVDRFRQYAAKRG
jgi:glyoxylase-like metal-dependent hydrolase (beta-lactamase superfamily II)